MVSEFSFGSNKFNVMDFLINIGESDPKKILKKTGPTELSHISKDENTFTLSVAACNKLILNHNIDKSSIKLLIAVTETPTSLFPGISFDIAAEMGLSANVELIDLNAGCTGFIDALSISMRIGKPALIVCAETYSVHMGEEQRSVKCLFSDAASATFLDPSDFRVILDETFYLKNTSVSISKKNKENIKMNGAEVYSFGLNNVFPSVINAVEKIGKPAICLIHQGSKLIVDSLAKKLSKYDLELPTNIMERGNCVSATIPILMCDSGIQDLRLTKKPVLFAGFGVGLYLHLLGLECSE